MFDLKLYNFQEEIVDCKKENIIMNWSRGAGATTAILYKILIEKPKTVLMSKSSIKDLTLLLNPETINRKVYESIFCFRISNHKENIEIKYKDGMMTDIISLKEDYLDLRGENFKDIDLAVFEDTLPSKILNYKIKQNISIIHINDYNNLIKKLFDNNENYFYSIVEREDKDKIKKLYKDFVSQYYNEIAILSNPFGKELNIYDLEKCFHKAKEKDKKYVGVKIQMAGFKEPEIIINENVNFDNKFDYYKKAYNEDLTLKTFNEIKIIGFTYGDTFEEIEKELLK